MPLLVSLCNDLNTVFDGVGQAGFKSRMPSCWSNLLILFVFSYFLSFCFLLFSFFFFLSMNWLCWIGVFGLIVFSLTIPALHLCLILNNSNNNNNNNNSNNALQCALMSLMDVRHALPVGLKSRWLCAMHRQLDSSLDGCASSVASWTHV